MLFKGVLFGLVLTVKKNFKNHCSSCLFHFFASGSQSRKALVPSLAGTAKEGVTAQMLA